MKPIAKAAGCIATAVAMLALMQGAASAADNTSNYWSNNSLTGYCGQTNGGYVVAGQEFLYAYGSYTGKIDNLWGVNSNVALRTYQSNHGLSVDGCAGSSTWGNMQANIIHFANENCSVNANTPVFRYIVGSRLSYYNHPQKWATSTSNDPVATPIQQFSDYTFSDNLIGPACT